MAAIIQYGTRAIFHSAHHADHPVGRSGPNDILIILIYALITPPRRKVVRDFTCEMGTLVVPAIPRYA